MGIVSSKNLPTPSIGWSPPVIVPQGFTVTPTITVTNTNTHQVSCYCDLANDDAEDEGDAPEDLIEILAQDLRDTLGSSINSDDDFNYESVAQILVEHYGWVVKDYPPYPRQHPHE